MELNSKLAEAWAGTQEGRRSKARSGLGSIKNTAFGGDDWEKCISAEKIRDSILYLHASYSRIAGRHPGGGDAWLGFLGKLSAVCTGKLSLIHI